MAAWVAVDWGTTHLRAWAMDDRDAVLAEARSDDGMAALRPDQFEPALLALIEPWLGPGTTPVIACGMVGSRQGWAEAPYRAVPCQARSDRLVHAPVRDARLDVRLIPGVKQDSPADVIRGEETQIAGYLSQAPDFDGVLCLPGTHSKWVHVSAGEIVSFRTFMTGELFDLLGHQSVLRHSIAPEGWDDGAFAEAVAEAMAKPEALAARFFALRAEALLRGQSPEAARARLSGLLIGAEMAAAKPYWLGQQVAMVGAPALMAIYTAALAAQGVTASQASGPEMTRAGLIAAHTNLSAVP
ncbi:MAG: 2-dehydro-3-deoxygalactonokinase [Rhodobacter sp.]|nr:2-dehydro-3-deoxygalactonokinase [Rhodobacter sp.]